MRAAFGSALRRYDSSSSTARESTNNSDAPKDMNWRALASSIGSSVKTVAKSAYEGGYNRVSNLKGDADTWSEWKQRRKEEIKGTEKLALFPGYAVKRPVPNSDQFAIEIFVDGYASSARPPELATRSQRAFMRLAKGFAALPKLPLNEVSGGTLVPDIDETRSVKSSDSDAESLFDFTELKGHLPPRPDQMDDELESAALRGNPDALYYKNPGPSTPRPTTPGPAPPIPHDELARLHANLDARLQPFWSSILPNRIVKLSIFVSNHHDGGTAQMTEDDDDMKPGPLVVQEVETSVQGYFVHRFKLSFEDICTHPNALPIAYGDQLHEHYLFVKAELQPPSPAANGTAPNYNRPPSPAVSLKSVNGVRPPLPPRPSSSSSPPVEERTPSVRSFNMSSPATAQMAVPITSAKVRLISDIDDTVKNTEVLSGLKQIYRNVFVKGMEDLIVPGMADWYNAMSRRGVRFHYVSNSPFELLPVLQEFFGVAGLPAGSVKLKFYGGRSILNGLWSGAAEKKQAGVLEILETFHDSQFFLVGDSGEQDLELYAAIAQERPHQILGVFIRNVSIRDLPDGIMSTDQQTMFSNAGAVSEPPSYFPTREDTITQASINAPPPPMQAMSVNATPTKRQPPPVPYRPRTPSRRSTQMSSPPQSPTTPSSPGSLLVDVSTPDDSPTPIATRPQPPSPEHRMSSGPKPPGSYAAYLQSQRGTSREDSYDSVNTALEKRRAEFKARIEAARQLIPESVILKIFNDPSECAETFGVLDKMGMKETS